MKYGETLNSVFDELTRAESVTGHMTWTEPDDSIKQEKQTWTSTLTTRDVYVSDCK